MTDTSNITYAQTFLGVETLQTRHSDSLDFYDVHVGAVTKMVEKIVTDRGESINSPQVSVLLYNHGWTGSTVEQGGDSVDFRSLSVWQISNIIKAAREF